MVTLLYTEQENVSLQNKQTKNKQKENKQQTKKEKEKGDGGCVCVHSSDDSCKSVLYQSSVTKYAVNRQANVLIIVVGK